ncbi:MAG TPA: cupredoxin domain-containing protein [Candidatus Limnocylindrales bacterium]|nr:cupredoxin domain-containing protein [Candidatus Limnocylindrales bacterium]
MFVRAVLAGLVVLALVACGSGAPAGPSVTPVPGAPYIAADKLAFQPTQLTVPAATAFDLTFENKESLPHNVAITTQDHAGQELFKGDLITGPKTVIYKVPALSPGTYFFHCDVHHEMKGTITSQ